MIATGLTGDELYCLSMLNLRPGDFLLGNSVYALGMVGSMASSFRGMVGGEVPQISNLISSGRALALERLEQEGKTRGIYGATGMRTRLVHHAGSSNIEFMALGSGVHLEEGAREHLSFSSSLLGDELFCALDAGYQPRKFVFGSVAYSMGVPGGILGALKTLSRGEVHEYSNILNHTRHLALQRICNEAVQAGANCVIDIEVHIEHYGGGVMEMYMIGTACNNPALPNPLGAAPFTSALPATDLWSMTAMGYAPLQLVMSSCVFSLGAIGGVKAFLKSFTQGEIPELTSLIYEAREEAIEMISKQASEAGADDIIGTRTFVIELAPSLVEFIAIGTAVKKIPEVRTNSQALPPQAFTEGEETFYLFHR